MKPKSKTDVAKQIERAQMELLSHALIGHVENVLGRVATDDEILKLGMPADFAKTPLSTFEKDGKSFHRFYVWNAEHAIAFGFMDPKKPTVITVCELRKEEWPMALKLLVEQRANPTPEGELG